MAHRSIPGEEPRPSRPLLLFDGDCAFCRRWVARWRLAVGEAADFAPFQASRPGWLPEADCQGSVWLLTPEGEAYGGAEAVFRLLALRPGGGGWLWLYRALPGFAPISGAVYRWVARHRRLASRLTRLLAGAVDEPPAFALARRAFLALLGLCYLSAFLSFAVQARGLIGRGGVWPFHQVLDWARGALPQPFLEIPSLLWLWPTDAGLLTLGAAGAACGLALGLGLYPRASALLAWALYLSLVSAGGPFFSYQWDALLLETGFLAIFLASRGPPPAVGLFLARVLLFRLMLLSGVLKLTSGDPAWRSLTGLQYHYWTQPLPTWSAYFADLLPAWYDALCEVAMFGIELVAPFLLFGPRRVRHLGAALLAALQLFIAATGNYGFFNLLTLCLCALQVDDSLWRRLPGLRGRGARGEGLAALPRGPLSRAGWAALFALLLLLGWVELWGRLRPGARWPGWVEALAARAAPLRVVNGYGLFAVMTTRREEIELQGSQDGQHWLSYRFRYKPGPLDERPRFAPLHLPRLDWQMWFAALRPCAQSEWLLLLQQGLLEGRPEVRALFAQDPFPAAPPRYLRTAIAPYRFAPLEQLRARGTWWTRGEERPFCPVLTLEGGRLRAVQQ